MLLDKHRDCRCINCQWVGMINMDDEYVCPKCGKEVMVGYTSKEIMEASQYGFYHTPEVYKTSQSKEEFKRLTKAIEESATLHKITPLEKAHAILRYGSMCEIAGLNLNVQHYIEHWEKRSIKAEEELERYKEWACKQHEFETGRDFQTQASS